MSTGVNSHRSYLNVAETQKYLKTLNNKHRKSSLQMREYEKRGVNPANQLREAMNEEFQVLTDYYTPWETIL